jgi:hypothetical protein
MITGSDVRLANCKLRTFKAGRRAATCNSPLYKSSERDDDHETLLNMRSLIALLVAASTSLVLGKECTVTYTEGQDDTPAIIDAFTQCATDSIITFEVSELFIRPVCVSRARI